MNDVRVIVMGVAGSGKSSIGAALADALGARFIDGDALHPAANVQKMAAGTPLDDDDRWPWLAAIRRELRQSAPVVIACSALKRRYRDMLRHAGDVVFVHLHLDVDAATARAAGREGHFMSAAMVQSQFDALEAPAADEIDVLTVDATMPVEPLVRHAADTLPSARHGTAVQPLFAVGEATHEVTVSALARHLAAIARDHIVARSARRVLLVPPDHTRLHSHAGTITAQLVALLEREGCTVGVLPALGTHVAMSSADSTALFGPTIAASRLMDHDWRNGLRTLGEIGAAEVEVVTEGRFAEAIPVAVDAQLFDGWDLVVSIGQVVPHEVIGMANFTKNIVIGLGGAPTIHRSHFVGAISDMERLMGRATSPVRDIVDAAFDRFIAPALPVLWCLTVVQDVGGRPTLRGLFVGEGGSMQSGGAAYRAAAALAQQVNLDILDAPLPRVSCWLDAHEFHSTWLGNKAIYRTRMALADDGVLYVLAPGVRRFGEDDVIDTLIRRHGYRGTPATLAAVRADPELAGNLGAAAHLVHGSSEGRFRVVYCTDPDTGGLSQGDVEGVGFAWMHLREAMALLGVDERTVSGDRADTTGARFFHVANPALGLWATADRFSR